MSYWDESTWCFSMTQRFKENVLIEDHIGKLPTLDDNPTPVEGELLGKETVFGTLPLHSFTFKGLQIDCLKTNWTKIKFSKENWDCQPALISLRSYLLGKKKGPEKENSVVTVYAGIKSEDIHYRIEFDKGFLQRLQSTLSKARIKAEVHISMDGAFRQFQLKDKLQFTYESKITEINDALGNKVIELSPTRFGKDCVTKSLLERAQKIASFDNENIEFFWKFQVDFFKNMRMENLFPMDAKSVLQSLYDLDDKNCVIVASNGKEIKCHRNVLSVACEAFAAMLSTENGMEESRTGRILLLKNTANGVEQFVKFLYGFPVPKEGFSCDLSLEIFQLANQYGIKSLERYFTLILIEKDVKWFGPDAILELYFLVRNIETLEDLRAHALMQMTKLSENALKECYYYNTLSVQDQMEVISEFEDWKGDANVCSILQNHIL